MSKNVTTRTWDSYVSEADRPDFILKVSDEKEIHISNPTGIQVMRLGEATRSGDPDAILAALTGDAWMEIRELIGHAGSKAVDSLLEDLMEHFDLFDEVELIGPGGGKVTESRPTRLRSLLRMGYKPVGEY